VVPTGIVVLSSKIGFNIRTELVLLSLDRAILRIVLVANLFLNRSNAVVVVGGGTTLGEWVQLLLLLLLLVWFHPPLELLLQVLTPLELVQPLLSPLDLVVKIFLKVVPWHHSPLFPAAGMVLPDVAAVVYPLDYVVGMSTLSGKNSNVLVVQIPRVSGM
jgi:hypothetical protein